MSLRLGLFALVGSVMCLYGLRIDESSLGVSKRIPTVGDRIVWQVPLVNDTDEATATSVTVILRVSCRGRGLSEAGRFSQDVRLDPGAATDIPVEWSPVETGYHTLVFELAGLDRRLTRRVPVVNRDLHFVWFGSPKEFRWCNVPTTVKDDEREWWLRRGAIPAAWKGGVCYKDWPVERFVKSWGEADWIAIDEVGGRGEVTDTFIAAWRQLKESKPEQFVAVWFMGAHDYWRDIADLIDLFVPEIYLNYRNNHLGQFDSYFETARQAGVMNQVIPGLGINQIRTKDKRFVNVSPDRRDVLRQFRYIKRTAPELNGIGFFTSYSCAWGVAEYADRLCEDYFIKPVITLRSPGQAIRVFPGTTPGTRRLEAQIANVGGMDAHDVTVEWRWGGPREGLFRRTVVARLACGATRTVSTEIAVSPGWFPAEVRLRAAADQTILDGSAETHVAVYGDGEPTRFPVFVRGFSGLPGVRFWMADIDQRFQGPVEAVRHDAALRTLGNVPCALLPARPGWEERQAVVMLAADGSDTALVTLAAGAGDVVPGPEIERHGDILSVSNAFYRADLDLGSDTLTRLSHGDSEANLFSGGWGFEASGHKGFGEARIEALSGCTAVTIPYSSDRASGESQYVFFAGSPAIRIARSWVPRGEVNVSNAGERASLFQKGGTYALRPGVGGPLRRGRLHDSNAYRDLLFGYLGGRPSPDNADRAGWLDMSYDADSGLGGLGVVIEERWRDAAMKSYDVTRLYDASDWIEVLHVWGRETAFTRPQRSCVYLVPHGPMDFTDPASVSPAQSLWRALHREQVAWCPMDSTDR